MPKKKTKRTISPEHLQKMQAGREKKEDACKKSRGH